MNKCASCLTSLPPTLFNYEEHKVQICEKCLCNLCAMPDCSNKQKNNDNILCDTHDKTAFHTGNWWKTLIDRFGIDLGYDSKGMQTDPFPTANDDKKITQIRGRLIYYTAGLGRTGLHPLLPITFTYITYTKYVFEYDNNEGLLIICVCNDPVIHKIDSDPCYTNKLPWAQELKVPSDENLCLYIHIRPITNDKNIWICVNRRICPKDEIPDIFTWKAHWNTICVSPEYYSHWIPPDLKLLIREYI